MHQHQALLQSLARLRADFGLAEDAVIRQQSAAADPELRIALGREHALNQLDPRPNAARVLPASARSAQPLAENRARRNHAPLRFLKRPRERLACPVARMHTAISDASSVVETASRDPLGMLFTWLTISIPSPSRRVNCAKNRRQRLARAFHSRRHNARSDHRRLQQSQIIAAEIEQLLQVADLRRRIQIDAHQPNHRTIDDAKISLDRRLRRFRVRFRRIVNRQ